MFGPIKKIIKLLICDETDTTDFDDDVDDIDDVDDVDDLGDIDGVAEILDESSDMDENVHNALTSGISAESISDKELAEMSGDNNSQKAHYHPPFTGIKGCNICRSSKCPIFTPVTPESDCCICGHHKNDHEW